MQVVLLCGGPSCKWWLRPPADSLSLATGALATASALAASAGYPTTAATVAILCSAAYVGLPTLQPQYSTEGYGSYRRDAPQALRSPPQLKRQELRADQGPWFLDRQGRRVLLRGVNLAGSSKYPVNAPTHVTGDFYDASNISFVGRPFPLAHADEHFARLRAWGLTFVRLLVTWEAVEHKGPGIYDEEYLDYLLQIVRKANEYNISCFIDPHQDVWSRWTGGDGAPAWTLDKVGFNVSSLHECGAAFTHQGHILETSPETPLPRMTWPSNHHKLATGTMFTLFFAGEDFAPKLQIDGQNVQHFLQGHYIAAMARVGECTPTYTPLLSVAGMLNCC